MTGTGDSTDFGLFHQDGHGHGGAICGYGGQAIQSVGGWGDVADVSAQTNGDAGGDAGGEVVAGIGTDVQVNDRCFICVLYTLLCVLALCMFVA